MRLTEMTEMTVLKKNELTVMKEIEKIDRLINNFDNDEASLETVDLEEMTDDIQREWMNVCKNERRREMQGHMYRKQLKMEKEMEWEKRKCF